MTPGFVGADLANIINEAALLAVAAGKREGRPRRAAGGGGARGRRAGEENRVLNPTRSSASPTTSSGHALVATSLPAGADHVHKISIIPRGVAALGYTMQLPTEDRFLMTESELENRVAMLLGGRAAEELIFDRGLHRRARRSRARRPTSPAAWSRPSA